MTKKHYEAIATQVKLEAEEWKADSTAAHAVSNMAYRLADIFSKDNPKFQRERFIQSCMPE